MAGLMHYECGCVYDSSPFMHLKGCATHPISPRGRMYSTREFLTVFKNQGGNPTGELAEHTEKR